MMKTTKRLFLNLILSVSSYGPLMATETLDDTNQYDYQRTFSEGYYNTYDLEKSTETSMASSLEDQGFIESSPVTESHAADKVREKLDKALVALKLEQALSDVKQASLSKPSYKKEKSFHSFNAFLTYHIHKDSLTAHQKNILQNHVIQLALSKKMITTDAALKLDGHAVLKVVKHYLAHFLRTNPLTQKQKNILQNDIIQILMTKNMLSIDHALLLNEEDITKIIKKYLQWMIDKKTLTDQQKITLKNDIIQYLISKNELTLREALRLTYSERLEKVKAFITHHTLKRGLCASRKDYFLDENFQRLVSINKASFYLFHQSIHKYTLRQKKFFLEEAESQLTSIDSSQTFSVPVQDEMPFKRSRQELGPEVTDQDHHKRKKWDFDAFSQTHDSLQNHIPV